MSRGRSLICIHFIRRSYQILRKYEDVISTFKLSDMDEILFKLCSNLPITVGSKSTKTARGTCFPAPVSLKKVLNESSPPPMVLSLGIWPSGWIPCSKQYNSQHAFPIWTPAWPTWIEIHSRWNTKCPYGTLSKQSRKRIHFLCKFTYHSDLDKAVNLRVKWRISFVP